MHFLLQKIDKPAKIGVTVLSDTLHKRPMGHIAHLRKQFKSINTYDYIITLIQRIKKKWEFIGSSFKQTWIPFTQGCFVPRLVEIGPVVLEKIFRFLQCIFAISYLSPLGNDVALHLNKLESFLPKDALSQLSLI